MPILPAVWPLLLLACAPEPVEVLAPDPARTGVDGADGPYGVLTTSLRVASRATDAVRVDVFWPDDPPDDPPALLHVHGGLVGPERYDWLAIHAASRGYVVLAPHHALNLALFEAGNAADAWDGVVDAAAGDGPIAGLVDADTRRAIAGHSLGGVVAAIGFAGGGWDAVWLEASFPADGTPVEDAPGAVLSLIGTADGSADAAAVSDGFDRFPGPGWFGQIDGMNHYDWTDDATPSELKSDGAPTRPQADTRRDALRVGDAFLDAFLRDDADARARLDAPFDGVELRGTP